MSDISSKLLELIITDIISNKSKLEKYQNLLKNNNASYKEADDYAVALGEITKAAFDNNVNSAVLPNGRMYYNIANSIIPKVLQSNFTDINNYCQEVQKLFNDNKGLTFNPVNVNINNDRLKGLIQSIADAENYDKVSKQFTESLINFGQAVVTDNIKANADFQYKTGKVLPVIRRMSTGKCCKWCTSLVGTYKYTPDMDTAVFRRHANCRCQVLYDNGSKTYQNAHTKKYIDKNTIDNKHFFIPDKINIENRKELQKQLKIKTFTNGSDVNKYFFREEQQWKSKLTDNEKRAIVSYTSSDAYETINKILRNGELNIADEITKDRIMNIDSAISKFNLEDNIKVYRYVNTGQSIGLDSENPFKLIGKDKILKGYTSTSPTLDCFEVDSIEDLKGVFLEIDVPKGRGNGAYINSLSAYKDAEYEFLVKQNARIVISDVVVDEHKTIVKCVMKG